MFGRKKTEDYDEYNEKINAQYDDDYIRPSEESRRECSHDHEQTYQNYESRQTYKDVESKQTYEDYNAEQKGYDTLNSIEDKFTPHLRRGEMIVWLGQTEKNAPYKHRGIFGCIMLFPIAWISLSLLTFLATFTASIFSALFSLFFIAAGIAIFIIMSHLGVNYYAITDQRVISVRGNYLTSTEFKYISHVKLIKSNDQIGSLEFRLSVPNGNVSSMCMGIYGIKNPTIVQGILHNAMARKRGWNTNY